MKSRIIKIASVFLTVMFLLDISSSVTSGCVTDTSILQGTSEITK